MADPKQGVGGPFVGAALFCENVLEEKDGVHSAIRIVDRFMVDPVIPNIPGLPADAKPAFRTFLFVIFKSGDFVGTKQLGVRLRYPSGRYGQRPELDVPLTFKGGEHGVSVRIGLGVSVEEFGLHWADVSLDGEVATRVPLSIQPLSPSKPVPSASQDAGA